MIILDTCALIFDALSPEKLSSKASKIIKEGEDSSILACCDISLWEIAMLIQKKRLNPGIDAQTFINLLLSARSINVQPVNVAIAVLSTENIYKHHDPADRLIASTALYFSAPLITCDKLLAGIPNLSIIW